MNDSAIPAVLQPAPASVTPLDLIGGSHTPKPESSAKICSYSVLKNAFFDWYQCSVSADAPSVLPVLLGYYGAATRPCRPQPPYLKAVELVPLGTKKNDATVVPYCSVHFGGYNERTLLRASSDNADDFSELVRKWWPEHRVSRVDVAMDFQEGPDFFNNMAEWLIDYAKNASKPLKITYAGDWANGLEGRTLYIGSRKSAVFIRLYEKGFEQLQKGNAEAPIDWVRFEAEIKPQNKAAKIRAASVPAREFFGSSALLRDFSALLGDQYEPLKMGTIRKMVDFDRTFSHMCYQYGALFEDLLEQCQGDPVRFLNRIMYGVQDEKDKRAGVRSRVKEYAKRDLRRSDLTASAVSVPPLDYPQSGPSSLSPSLVQRYPAILRGLVYRKTLCIHGEMLLAPR